MSQLESSFTHVVVSHEPGLVPLGPGAALRKSLPSGEIPKHLDDLTESVTRSFDLSVTAAASLSIPVVGSVSGGYSRRVIVLERTSYKPITAADGTVYQYGYALRLCVTVSKWDASLKLSLPFLAASAEVGNISAGWMLQILGLAGPKIDAVSVPPTELNVETFVLAKQSLTALIAAVRDPTTKFTAQPVATVTPAAAYDEALRLATAQTYALSRIERRASRQDALDRLDTTDTVVIDGLADLYARFVGADALERPSEEVARKASALLGRVAADAR